MQHQPKRVQALLLLLAVATVASVPTSVLVQNSELAANMNNNHNNNNANNAINFMPKVKRSSGSNTKDAKDGSATAATNANAGGLDKKSSPEIVPASFNAPPAVTVNPVANAGVYALPSNGDIINSAIAAGLTAAAVEAANQQQQAEYYPNQLQQQQQLSRLYGGDEETPTLLHKRGINAQQYLYGGGNTGAGYAEGYGSPADYYKNPYLASAQSAAAVPAGSGIWADELDPAVVYTDLQDLDDYVPAPKASHRSKAYDNLQNLLNSESEAAYLEPAVPMSVQYPSSRFYNALDADRNKRSNLMKFNKFNDMRLKRDTKLTPADMLALVALVEAGERARKDNDEDSAYNYAPAENYPSNRGYYPSERYEAIDDTEPDYSNGFYEPSVVDYYNMPVNVETVPKYETIPAREHKYGGNRYGGAKRFMVAKKKRSLSLGKFLDGPVAKPSISFNSNGEKYY